MRYTRFVQKGFRFGASINGSQCERSHNKQRKAIIEIIRWLLLSTKQQQKQQKTNDIISRSLILTHTLIYLSCPTDGDDTIRYDTIHNESIYFVGQQRNGSTLTLFLTYNIYIHPFTLQLLPSLPSLTKYIGFHISY